MVTFPNLCAWQVPGYWCTLAVASPGFTCHTSSISAVPRQSRVFSARCRTTCLASRWSHACRTLCSSCVCSSSCQQFHLALALASFFLVLVPTSAPTDAPAEAKSVLPPGFTLPWSAIAAVFPCSDPTFLCTSPLRCCHSGSTPRRAAHTQRGSERRSKAGPRPST